MADQPEPIVIIVDDDPSMREALSSLLASIGQASRSYRSAAEFLAEPLPDAPCCIVLDVRMPELSGLDLQRMLVDAGVRAPLIFISGHADVPMSVAAMKAGAVEFLEKPFRDQDLLDAIQRAIRLDRVRRAEQADLSEASRLYEALTAREREVMALVVDGLANKQIAGQLGISEITVKVHRANLIRKMQVRSLPELVRIADRMAGSDEATDPSV